MHKALPEVQYLDFHVIYLEGKLEVLAFDPCEIEFCVIRIFFIETLYYYLFQYALSFSEKPLTSAIKSESKVSKNDEDSILFNSLQSLVDLTRENSNQVKVNKSLQQLQSDLVKEANERICFSVNFDARKNKQNFTNVKQDLFKVRQDINDLKNDLKLMKAEEPLMVRNC